MSARSTFNVLPSRTRKAYPCHESFVRSQQAGCGHAFFSYTRTTRFQPAYAPGEGDAASLFRLFSAAKRKEAIRAYSWWRGTWERGNMCKVASTHSKCDSLRHCGFASGTLEAEGQCESLDKSRLMCLFSSGYKSPLEVTERIKKCKLLFSTPDVDEEEREQIFPVNFFFEEDLCDVGSSAGFLPSGSTTAGLPTKGLSLAQFLLNFRITPRITTKQKDRADWSESVLPFSCGSIVADERRIVNYANKCSIHGVSSQNEKEICFTKKELKELPYSSSKKTEMTFGSRRVEASNFASAKLEPSTLSSTFLFSSAGILASALQRHKFFCFQDLHAHSTGISSLPWPSAPLHQHQGSTRGTAVHVEDGTSEGRRIAGAAQLVNNVTRDYSAKTRREKNAVNRCAKGYERISANDSGALRCSDRKRKIMNGTEYIRRKTGHRGRIKRSSQAPAYKRR